MDNKIIIRKASIADVEELLDIYKYYVENTAISFEWEAPSLQEFTARIENTLKKYPYLVAVLNSEIIGYTYASPFKQRRAYDWAVETTIYVKKGFDKIGCGKLLYTALEDSLKKQNIINVNACIAYTDTEDEYLTNNSMQFHSHLGYRLVGKFYKCGYKFGKWYDMLWMEKLISEHPQKPKEVIPFENL